MTYNIFKHKVTSLALAVMAPLATGMLSSCSDFLDVEPQNVITEDQFWNQETDVQNIISGIYAHMAANGWLSRAMVWGEFRSDNVTNNGSIEKDVSLERVLKENLMANNGYTTWTDFYTVINRCNTVIEKAPAVAEVDPSYTESEVNAHIAEVTALRALSYFYLIRTFRDVPYSEEAFLDDSQTLALPASSFSEVLQKQIAALEAVRGMAITRYPTNSGLAAYYNTGRVTRDFIDALLCEMYLWNGDYAKCIEYADNIIEHKSQIAKEEGYTASDFETVNGYPILSDKWTGSTNSYGRAFTSIFLTGNSMESIFEINFDKDGEDRYPSNVPANAYFGGLGRAPYVIYTSYVSDDLESDLGFVFAKSNNKQDARSYEYMNRSGKYINKNTLSRGTFQIMGTKDNYEWMMPTQWPTAGTNQDSRNKSNYIIYRLTDIMLLKAEALACQMSEGSETLSEQDTRLRNQAFDLVSAVNKRSLMQQTPKDTLVLSDYATKTAITNLVFEERHRELMFEGKRYYDLVRRSQREGNTDYMRDKISQKNVDLKSVIQSKMAKMDGIFWPYNTDEIKANPNLKQNPSFGSGENTSYEAN